MKVDDTETLYRKYMLLQEEYRRLHIEYERVCESERQLQRETSFYRSMIPVMKNEILELIKK